jgi:predicted ribonuclease YlaK
MKYLVLDTSIVIRNPSALSVSLPEHKIVIPDIVQREIDFIASKRRDTAGLPALIRESAEKGIVKIERAPSEFAGKLKTSSLTLADALIFQYLEYLQTAGQDFCFVTADQELIELCAARGIATIGRPNSHFFFHSGSRRMQPSVRKRVESRDHNGLTTR